MFEEIAYFVNTVGFPIATTCYFIYDKIKSSQRLEKLVEDNGEVTRNNTKVMAVMCEKMTSCDVKISRALNLD